MSAIIKKRKVLKNFKNIQTNNKQFVAYIDDLMKRNEEQDFSLQDGDKHNLNALKEHLDNMTVLFQQLSESMTNNNKTGS